jgi:hypothetical protein
MSSVLPKSSEPRLVSRVILVLQLLVFKLEFQGGMPRLRQHAHAKL